MNPKQAISIISKHRPCPHDNADTEIGNGRTWAKCDDCNKFFKQKNWGNYRKDAAEFDKAVDVLSNASKYAPAKHGLDCKKAEHDGGGGYYHSADDNSHYTVGGWVYCGRCHEYLGDK